MGAGVIDLDLVTGHVAIVEARTFDASQLIRQAPFPQLVEIHGERYVRLLAHEENLVGYFSYWQPHNVVSESPYMGRFPQAYAALVECVNAVRRAVYRYDAFKPLIVVDPMNVKLAVGVSGKGQKRGNTDQINKHAVKAGLINLINSGNLLNPSLIDIDALDEHSVDALAVAYSQAKYFQSLL